MDLSLRADKQISKQADAEVLCIIFTTYNTVTCRVE